MFNFLFWLFFFGILVALFQDLKRREVDNWLNYFLLVFGFVFIFYKIILERDFSLFLYSGFTLIVMFFFMNVFYYGRVFAGGDAKLLVALSAFFVAPSFFITSVNIGVFLFFLMFAGSVYGLSYSFVLYFKDFKKVNSVMEKYHKNRIVKSFLFLGLLVFLFGFFEVVFFFLGFLLFIFPLLYIFAKGLEDVSMIKEISGKELREGDWLANDVKVGKNVVKSSWDGLSEKEIRLLKNKNKIKIKNGFPFVPAFLIAFLGYAFLRDIFVAFLFRMN